MLAEVFRPALMSQHSSWRQLEQELRLDNHGRTEITLPGQSRMEITPLDNHDRTEITLPRGSLPNTPSRDDSEWPPPWSRGLSASS